MTPQWKAEVRACVGLFVSGPGAPDRDKVYRAMGFLRFIFNSTSDPVFREHISRAIARATQMQFAPSAKAPRPAPARDDLSLEDLGL